MAKSYRCDFSHGAAGRKAQAIIHCENDAHAKMRAAEILASAGHYRVVKVWQGVRCVDTQESLVPIPDLT